MGGAFEQPRVNVKNVARKSFAPGRPAQQQRELAISARVVREIVVNDQHVAARFHEMFRDAGRGIRRDVSEPGRIVPLGHDHDRVIHRALLAQTSHSFGDRRRALTNGAINTDDIAAALIKNGVDRDRGLARSAVAQNQLALPAPDRNERVDHFQSGLKRHRHRRAIHDRCRGSLDRQTFARCHGPIAIERSTKRIDHAPEQPFAHRHIHDPSGPLNFIARVQTLIFAEQNNADFLFVHVERDPKKIAGKLEQFLKARIGKAGDPRDASRDADDRARLHASRVAA